MKARFYSHSDSRKRAWSFFDIDPKIDDSDLRNEVSAKSIYRSSASLPRWIPQPAVLRLRSYRIGGCIIASERSLLSRTCTRQIESVVDKIDSRLPLSLIDIRHRSLIVQTRLDQFSTITIREGLSESVDLESRIDANLFERESS